MTNRSTATARVAGPDERGFRASLFRLRRRLYDSGKLDTLAYVGLALVAYLVFFYDLDDFGILNGNESLYVEAAREMALSGQWAIPTLNGLPYLEKPPLFVWLLVAFGHLGQSIEAAPRLVSACAATLLVVGILRFAVLFKIGRIGVVTAFIAATSLGVVIMSSVAMPDLTLTTLFSLGCLSFLAALLEGSRSRYRIAAALLGAASLVKGLLALALFALIVLACYATMPALRQRIRALVADPWAVALMLLPFALWLVAIEAALPGAAYHVVIDEHVLRFLGKREPHDYYSGSLLYYVPRLFLFFFPWSGALLFGWLSGRNASPQKTETRQLLWLCVWVPFVFFSLSSAKANYYVLLCLPPLALLTADYLPSLLSERRSFHLAMAIITPILVLVAIWTYRIWLVHTGRTTPLLPASDGSAPLTVAVLMALSLLVLALVQLNWRRLAVLGLGGLLAPVSIQFDHLVVRAEPYMSAGTLAAVVEDKFPDAQIFLYQDFEAVGALPVYLKRTIPVIDSRSNDLYYGRAVRPDHPNFVTEKDVLSVQEEKLIVVMDDRQRNFAGTGLAKHAEEVAHVGNVRLFRISR